MEIGPLFIPCEYFAVGLIAVFLVLSLVASDRRRQEFAVENARITVESDARGWTHEGERKGGRTRHHFCGQTRGITWQIESTPIVKNESTNTRMRQTRWWTDQVTLSGETILIGRKRHNQIQLGELPAGKIKTAAARIMNSYFLKTVIHGDPKDVAELDNLQPVDAGSDTFNYEFAVHATTESSARRFIDRDAESALIDFDETGLGRYSVILYWKHGLTIATIDETVEPSELEKLVKLGAALASGQRGA
jgi:hypothetical protein